MSAINKQNGFSLLEVVVSVAIISIILLSIALLSTKSLQMAQMAQMRQKAIIYAREGIEQIRNDRAANSWTEFKTTKLAAYLPSLPMGDFTRTVTLSPVHGSIIDIVNVTCTVNWVDSKGTHEVVQTTKLTKWL